MLTVKEIGRVLRVRRARLEPWKRREGRAGPLPPVADKVLHAPGALSVWVAARRLRIPAHKVEDSVHCGWRVGAPGVRSIGAVWSPERGALKLPFRREPATTPARVGRRFCLAHVHGPPTGQRHQLEHPTPVPSVITAFPEMRVTNALIL